MGGIGSGRWLRHIKRQQVEDCLSLDINVLLREGLLRPGEHLAGELWWLLPASEEPQSACDYEADLREAPCISLRYETGGQSAAYRIDLTHTRLHKGGRRWWFCCPALGCGKRIGKLYLAPSGLYFACRHCYRLSYRSSQESNTRLAELRLLFSYQEPASLRGNVITGRHHGLPPFPKP